MHKFFKDWMLTVSLVFVFSLVFAIPAKASSVAAPTVLKINSFKTYSISSPVISGVTAKNSNVLVYIDDVFSGSAKIQESESLSDSFYFQTPKLETGIYQVYLVAEDKKSLIRSDKSKLFELVISGLSAPTLVVPNKDTITAKEKPLIEGFTRSGTLVHLYIDGVYNGKTAFVEHESGTAHFGYKPFLNLEVGKHVMWAVAEDIEGNKSKLSKVVEFYIENKNPAPTIFYPVLNNDTVYNFPFIVGLARNNSKLKIFIDHKLDGEIKVVNHESGTANFAYKPKEALTVGKHFVYVTAVDSRGKESNWSNVVYFNVFVPSQAKISDVAVVEESETVTEPEQKEDVAIEEQEDKIEKVADSNKDTLKDFIVFADLYQKDKTIRLHDSQYQKLEELLERKSELAVTNDEINKLSELLKSKDNNLDNKEELDEKMVVEEEDKNKEEIDFEDASSSESVSMTVGGLIDESKNKQSKLGWNAIVFIMFLASVIAWIFWVNRELIKEKKEQEEQKDKQE